MKFKFINKNSISRLPKSCGVYVFKKGRQILYIGKATNLKERVKNHFQQTAFRDNIFINQVEKIGYIKTDSEFSDPANHLPERSEGREMNGVQRTTSRPASQGSTIEALILEAKLIKKYKPKYNIVWRDDKNYFYVGITKDYNPPTTSSRPSLRSGRAPDFPTVFITHQPADPKIDYVGPFVDGRALKQALNTLRRVFPYRTCKSYSGKPCLWYQLGRCPGPCLLGSKLANEISKIEETIKKESQRNAKNLKKILEGGKNQVLKDLKREMKKASKIRDFEKAAKIRDQINALERILSHAMSLEIIEPEKNGREKTEKELKRILNLKRKISRIEAYDVSNIQGKHATGSMVTFVNGRPDKNFYRKFKIHPVKPRKAGISPKAKLFNRVKIEQKPNDVAMLKEILTRRFQHPDWGWPDLVLVDGGAAQLSAARQAKNKERRAAKNIKVIALAKRKNELFIEGQKTPILLKKLPREIFNLILQLRDEAHRFALSYHRKLREKF